MEKINILFANDNNCREWDEYECSDIKILHKDLNIDDITLFLNELDDDFPNKYIRKPCIHVEDADFRLETMRELMSDELLYDKTSDLIALLRKVKKIFHINAEIKNERQKHYHFLFFIQQFIGSIISCRDVFRDMHSAGLKRLSDFCAELISAKSYEEILSGIDELVSEASGIISDSGISINQNDKTVTIVKCDPEANESEKLKRLVADVFGINIKNDFSIVNPNQLSALEGRILDTFISDYPEFFDHIENLYKNNDLNDVFHEIMNVIPQLTFYVKYIFMVRKFISANITVCEPVFIKDGIFCNECINFSLAIKYIKNMAGDGSLVKNNIRLPAGKIFILSGPNQGGKTTYLRMTGLIAHLAKCGCYVTGSECRVKFFDKILTHFPKKELLGKGRLVEEIDRMENIVKEATSDSLVLWNESFTSTRRQDGVELALCYLDIFSKIGSSLGFVSHFYEIPGLFKKDMIISLISIIGGEGKRTYKIIETAGDGMAYAHDIALTCGVTYDQLLECLMKSGVK